MSKVHFLMSADELNAAIVKDAKLSTSLYGEARETALAGFVTIVRGEARQHVALCEAATLLGDFEDTKQTLIAAYLSIKLECSVKEAAAIVMLPGVNSKESPKRDAVQEKAYGAARTAWSRVRAEVGFAAPTGSGSKSTGAKPTSATSTAEAGRVPVALPSVVLPHVTDTDDGVSFLVSVAAMLTDFGAKNASKFVGDKGMAVRDAIEAFTRAVKSANVIEDEAPTKSADAMAKLTKSVRAPTPSKVDA